MTTRLTESCGGPVASPPPPASRGSRLTDVGARRLAQFLVRQPRFPVTPEPLADRQAARAGRPTRAAATQRPPTTPERGTAMTTPTRPDTTGPALPEAVRWLLGGRDGRCGCTGQCGRNHARGRCDADDLAGLTVAPADLTIPLEQAAVLPAEQLLVWCHRCRDLATAAARRRRRHQVADQLEDAQLGLWGAA
jgi:hypothetical protein